MRISIPLTQLVQAMLCALLGAMTMGCSSGPPPPTLNTAGSGVSSKQMLDNVQNSNIPDFNKRKREKAIQGRMAAGG